MGKPNRKELTEALGSMLALWSEIKDDVELPEGVGGFDPNTGTDLVGRARAVYARAAKP